MKSSFVWAGVAVLFLIIGAFVFLDASGHNTDSYTALLTIGLPLLLGSGVSSWKGLQNGKALADTQSELAKVRETVEKVEGQTNGPLTAGLAKVEQIHNAVVPDTTPEPAP